MTNLIIIQEHFILLCALHCTKAKEKWKFVYSFFGMFFDAGSGFSLNATFSGYSSSRFSVANAPSRLFFCKTIAKDGFLEPSNQI